MKNPSKWINSQKIDLAGNAFCGYVCTALCMTLMGTVDWDVALSAKSVGVDGEGEEEEEEQSDQPLSVASSEEHDDHNEEAFDANDFT
jgi:hypothetical protein